MPKRNRARELAKAQEKAERSQRPKSRAKRKKPKKKGPQSQPDPSDVPDAEVRFISGMDAVKEYICPGCSREIPPRLGHIVAVPPDAPDLRRHWHRGCWDNRSNLR